MRLSEAITIYLAAGAPFGVSYYLGQQKSPSGLRERNLSGLGRLARAAAAALLWPLMATAILKKSQRHSNKEAARCDRDAQARESVDEATRRFVRSVQAALEQASRAASAGLKKEELERALHILRESLEQYAALAGSPLEEYGDAAPAEHELELNRVAGRRGDDLAVAGLCVHRRNLSRIITRRRRARARSLAALATLAAEANALSASREHLQDASRRQMYESLLEIFGRAHEVFSLLDDTGAAATCARLMDAERSRLRELQESNRVEARTVRAAGEERCTDHAPQLIFTEGPRETTLTQG